MEFAFLFASAMLLIGLLLRAKIRLLQVFYVPAAITGGLVGLAILQGGIAAAYQWPKWVPDWAALMVGEQQAWPFKLAMELLGGIFLDQTASLIDELHAWPGWLIAVVFAGLFLDQPVKPWRQIVRGAAQQGNMVWIICLGQVAIGLLAVWLIIDPLQLAPFDGDVPIYFGQLIEAGFVGGHGTSAALGKVYDAMGFGDATDLAFFMATVGLIYSVVSGMIFVNLGVRRGWTRGGNVHIERISGLENRNKKHAIGWSKVNSEVLDPLVFQAIILGCAFAIGLGLQKLVGLAYDGLPLFMFTLIGGWLVRDAMKFLGIDDLIDPDTIRRLVAAAMEYLIVAAIVSLNISLVVQSLVPLTILLAVAFVWTAVCLLVIGRRLLPSGYWFELGIINYGMSTGVTASGLMLLRIIDKDFESGAAQDYALAAPLSSPFVGGGIITIVVYPAMLTGIGVPGTTLIVSAATVALIWLGLFLAKRQTA